MNLELAFFGVAGYALGAITQKTITYRGATWASAMLAAAAAGAIFGTWLI